jgi:hypothetical protein
MLSIITDKKAKLRKNEINITDKDETGLTAMIIYHFIKKIYKPIFV